MIDVREMIGSPAPQGSEEIVQHRVNTVRWGGSPNFLGLTVLDLSAADADVTNTVATGSGSVAGDIITLPWIRDLTIGHRYKCLVRFSSGTQTWEPYFILVCGR